MKHRTFRFNYIPNFSKSVNYYKNVRKNMEKIFFHGGFHLKFEKGVMYIKSLRTAGVHV